MKPIIYTLLTLEEDGTIVASSPDGPEVLGVPEGELLGQSLADLVVEGDVPAVYLTLDEVSSGANAAASKWVRLGRPESIGGAVVLEVRKVFGPGAPGQLMAILQAPSAASERRSRGLERAMFEAIMDSVILADGETGLIVDVNDAACTLMQRSRADLIGSHQGALHPEDKLEEYQRLFAEHVQKQGAFLPGLEIVRPSGERVPVEIASGGFVSEGKRYLIGVFRDVSERQMMERQLRKAEKMEVIGQLASGIAHDFNNLLTVILSCAEYLVEALPPDSDLRDEAVDIKQAGQRASELTRHLTRFSKHRSTHRELLELKDVLGNIESILFRLIPESVGLSVRCGDRELWIRADYTELEQLLTNLVVNACDAMPNGGRVVVDCTGIRVHADDEDHRRGVPPGYYARLIVSDEGQGMGPDTLSHIFDPLFTTKSEGSGTGLGLATVQSIVDHYQGTITVESEVEEGTRFTVFLPALVERPTEAEIEAEDPA